MIKQIWHVECFVDISKQITYELRHEINNAICIGIFSNTIDIWLIERSAKY